MHAFRCPRFPLARRPLARGLAVAALLLAASGPVGASDMISLRDKAVIDARDVRLSDLFSGVPASKDAAIMPAPEIGQRVRLSSKRLSGYAARHDLDWDANSGRAEIAVTRAAHRIGHQQIEDTVVDALRREGVSAALTITLRDDDLELVVPTTADPTLRVEDLTYRQRSHRFTARVVAPARGEPEAREVVTGKAVEILELPVPNRRINRGEIIRERDLDWVTRPADELRRRHVEDVSEVVGKAAQRTLRADAPIRVGAVAKPIVVEDGALVTIKLKNTNMSLTARGEALEDGAVGDTIRVENTASQQTVTGVVDQSGAVVVETGPMATN